MISRKKNGSAQQLVKFHLSFGLLGGVLILAFLMYIDQGPAMGNTEAVPTLRSLFKKATIALLIWTSVLGLAARYYGRMVLTGRPSYGRMLLSAAVIVTIASLLSATSKAYFQLHSADSNFQDIFQYFFFLGIFVAFIITALAYQGYRTKL